MGCGGTDLSIKWLLGVFSAHGKGGKGKRSGAYLNGFTAT